ncbi:hypothetical protein C2S53_001898 [Perilla frutescens var. hirtella]|uniref:Dof zinc finger protein n=1 Tax=Perilla frutescens var. hirtella TaxID=608512 RepID=A0AAD4J032_PERFH|nr:hypothetical protein C2S53_001898 [Perilla frutescens var. hirtella]
MEMESSPITTPTGDEMLTCSRPLIERRLRPQHEQSLKCPRCESTHTKFCYYNNYSLSQPRYFCKTCRRYWTKGGTLRNIPVGGGCRKNKKVSSKKPSSSSSSADHNNNHNSPSSTSPLLLTQPNVGMSSPLSYGHHHSPTDLHLAFPDQLHFASLHAAAGLYGTTTGNYLLDNNPTPIDFMENKYEALLGGHDGFIHGEGFGGVMAAPQPNGGGFHPFGMSAADHGNPAILESCQRLMLPYDNHHQQNDVVDTKPNAKILSLEWHDHQQACNSDAGKDSFGYSFGSWTGLMNGYGSSATNPLV